MKKQYLAQYKSKGFGPDTWMNASSNYGGSRYLNTLEEAQEAIKRVVADNNKGARTEFQQAGHIGVQLIIDEDTADVFTVVATRIRVREVTEWEDVE